MKGTWRYSLHALVYRAVLWYVERRGGVLHALPYHAPKRYLVAMGEHEYVRWTGTETPPPFQPRIYSFSERMQGRLWKSR